jgi:dolichol-phosphate mannosyltransferase
MTLATAGADNLTPYIQSLRGPILVTGASGFIGANLFHQLLAVRSDVFACTRRDKGHRLAHIPDNQVVGANLNDTAAVRNMVAALKPQTVFHCAAYGAYSFEQEPGLIYQTNFQSVVNLVGELAKEGISAFIHAGSSSEYGTNCAGPLESDARLPSLSEILCVRHNMTPRSMNAKQDKDKRCGAKVSAPDSAAKDFS